MHFPALLQLLRSWPPELATALLAAVPFTEVRASIPLGLRFFHLSPWNALWSSFLGSLIPMPFVFWLFPPFLHWLERHMPPLHRFLDRYVRKLETHHRALYERLGVIALFLIIAVPITGAGVWSASLLAVVFEIRRPLAAVTIIIGIFAAALIMLGITLGFFHFF